jgi:hypothetical protein
MKKILIFFLILSMFIFPGYSEMKFTFVGIGEEGVMTTYTKLVEPRVQETEMSRGLEAGSFNHLDASNTGGKIEVREDMTYDYGNRTINNSGSNVVHNLKVDFKGTRGISEFYARGFYNNNRYLSAWKKIRYEDTKSLKQPAYPTYNSSAISVRAISDMNTEKGSYSMLWKAKVAEGVIQTQDAVGWSNLTGARRVEWEHETLSRGKLLDITNGLSDYNLTTAAGGYDWLPCFCSGTIPTIEGIDWPTQRMVKVLQANTLLPTFKMQRDYYFSSPSCVIGKCSNNTSTCSQS